jgi:pyruvate/2-oxoglutarate/acetoin dehydrogenase E1 component
MELTYVQSLNSALFDLFESDSRVYLIGEDLLDPYGGAFKVSKGLSIKFPDRVIPTPISEACIIGIGAGLAMRGLRPIVEIMFGDFITLGVDQIINHIAKFRQMYNDQVKVPIAIRTPMGGGRGYGPTHSQSLEKIFLGIPGLKIVAPSHFHNPGEILKYATIKDEEPVIFIEHKLLYPLKIITNSDSELFLEYKYDNEGYPIAIIKNYKEGKKPDIIILSYGGISYILEPLLRGLYGEEINVIAYLPSQISNVSVDLMAEFIRECGKVIVIEEGTGSFGWSAEISSQIYEKFGRFLEKPIKRLTSFNSVIPAAKHLENSVLPNKEKIEKIMEEMLI